MKIGDLVKFSEVLTGLEDCLGIVISFNGASCVDVRWMDRHSARAVEITGDRANEMSSELAEFLEVVSENR
jgi:hypothetical protein|tara:strand:+ start:49 stop:261 length:213 start_codon:yes stop_codon:yes gene_type:complete